MELIHGDCLEEMGKLIESGVKVDCVLTDPPYGTTACKWDEIISFDEMWKKLNKLIKPNGATVLFSSQPFTSRLICSNIKNFKYTWYWIKNIKGNYLNAKRQPLRQVEDIVVFNKHNYYPQGITKCNKISTRGFAAKTTNQGYSDTWFQENTNYPSNILYYNLDKDKYHPTQKPIALLEYLIKTYTNESETVLDFTMGSGSTGVACINTNRNFIGIEKEEKYFNIAKERIKTAYGGD